MSTGDLVRFSCMQRTAPPLTRHRQSSAARTKNIPQGRVASAGGLQVCEAPRGLALLVTGQDPARK